MGRELASPFCDLKRTSSFVAEDALQVAKEHRTKPQHADFEKGLRRSKSEKNVNLKDHGMYTQLCSQIWTELPSQLNIVGLTT